MSFWDTIAAQLSELESAEDADAVVRILSQDRNPDGPGPISADGFFAGSGGDDTVEDALRKAGWVTVWRKASYHYCLRAPGGSAITYVEGDVYIDDRR